MDVGTAELRANLKHYLDLAARGEEVVITDRNVSIARITSIDAGRTIAQLERDGLIAPPARASRRRSEGVTRVRAKRPVSDLVSEQRR